MISFRCLVVLFFSAALAAPSSPQNTTWLTLDGTFPLVIAKGGFAGVFPDSSKLAYHVASRFSLPGMISWCNVLLTKDGHGVCLPELNLENSTNVNLVFPSKKATYTVNYVSTTGWFPSDFTHQQLSILMLMQGSYARSPDFDGEFRILTVEDVSRLPTSPDSNAPRSLWLNFENDAFYKQQGLDLVGYAGRISSLVDVQYISSPEVSFLKVYHDNYNATTKLVLKFGEKTDYEPSNDITYGALLNSLPQLKRFIHGILVPKTYIWPVDSDAYQLPQHTSLVSDAHRLGLKVFVTISNDVLYSYDVHFDPVVDTLSYIDNKNFSVDGVISDFPLTPSAAIDCFSHIEKDDPVQSDVLVISHEGARGVYPGCTDLAYDEALDSGADIIDCPVQMTKDGVPVCLGNILLNNLSAITDQRWMELERTIPELGSGLFTFDFTWSQIQTTLPMLRILDQEYELHPNKKYDFKGKYTTFADFVEKVIESKMSGNTSISGVMITIQHADYLKEKQGLDVVSAVLDILNRSNIRYTGLRVLIHSSDRSLLLKIREETGYERVYEKKDVTKISNSEMTDILNFANAVMINKEVEYPDRYMYNTGEVPIIQQLHKYGMPVYVKSFRNEFVYQDWDYFSDPYVELDQYVMGAGANGIISDFPRTADKFRRNRCLGRSNKPAYMMPIKPVEMLKHARTMPADWFGSTQTSDNSAKNRRLGKHRRPSNRVHV